MNFLNNIYILSKLSVVFVLTGLLFFMGYLFYKSYNMQKNTIASKNKEETTIVELINDNSKKIKSLNLVLEDLNKSIININENTQSKQKHNVEFNKIFYEIKKEIQTLSLQIESIKKSNKIKDKKNKADNITINNLNEIINLLRLKFESGKNLSPEIDILSKLNITTIDPIIEKMYLLNNLNFIGNEKLILEFQDESNNYISEVIINKNNIIKPLLSFIEIQPSKKNNLKNTTLINLKKANELIIKKQYDKSFLILKSLNNHNKYFSETIEQLKIGIDFYSTLEGLI